MIYPAEMVIMATLQCSPAEAHTEYLRIEPILINLQHEFPLTLGATTASTLNVRARSTTAAASIGTLQQGAVVEVWGRTPANDWLAVRTPDGQLAGWVAQQYVTEQA